MPNKTLTIEHVLYLAAFLLAVALRTLHLGALPLSEHEAGWAMQALDLRSGLQVNIGPQPLYVIFTSILFNLLGSGEFLARLLPLLGGLLLVAIPYYFREQLGDKAALLLCIGLAIDPTLVGLSRTAGSPIPAVAFTLSTLAAWQWRKPRLAAIFAALALLSGPSIFSGILSLGLAWALANYLIPGFKSPLPALEPIQLRQALFPFGAVLLVAGTALLRYPQGLSALGSTLSAYFSGWGKVSGATLSQFAIALLAYQTLALIFALLAIWQVWRRTAEPFDRFLSLWLLAALLLVLSNPSRHPADLVWVILPLWTLACRFIAFRLRWTPQDGLPVWGQTVLTILLLTFLLMSAIRLSSVPYSSAALSSFQLFGRNIIINQQTVSLISIFALGIVSSILIGAGWSPVAASRGLVWGSTAVLAIYSLSVAWYPSHLPSRIDRELWFTSPGPANIDYLSEVIGDFSEYAAGLRTGIEVASTYSSELLRWELRNFPQARFLSSLPEDFSPAILITAENSQNPRLPAYYRGQAIPLLATALWSQFSASQWQRWWLFREVAFQNESVILWVRSDIFPEDYSLLDDFDPLPEAIVP